MSTEKNYQDYLRQLLRRQQSDRLPQRCSGAGRCDHPLRSGGDYEVPGTTNAEVARGRLPPKPVPAGQGNSGTVSGTLF